MSLLFSPGRNKIIKAIALVLGGIAVASGAWLGFRLIEGNGLLIAIFPVVMGAAGIVNSIRKRKSK